MNFLLKDKPADVRNEAQKARINLKAIESLTYVCTDAQELVKLNETLSSVLVEFKKALPAEQGVVVRPQITKRVKRSDNIRSSKVSLLPLYKKRGKNRADSKYRNRFGKRAETMRNVRIML